MTYAEDVKGIASIISGFRKGEVPPPDASHVQRWLSQFDAGARAPIAPELHHLFGKVYLPKPFFEDFLTKLAVNASLTGGNATQFWSTASVLDRQKNGGSQREMLALLRPIVLAQTGAAVAERLASATAVYIDDVLFSGSRIRNDLTPWIQAEAPPVATLHIIVIAFYESGRYFLEKHLKAVAAAAGKQITIKIWRAFELNAKKSDRDIGQVLWPTFVPPEAAAYQAAAAAGFQPRTPGKHNGFFSSEAGRAILEQELLKAGIRIRGFSQNPSTILRPLGFSGFGFGFGSILATYRNCPNNAPLALWWGDPNAHQNHPFKRWYPLLPRATYGGAEG